VASNDNESMLLLETQKEQDGGEDQCLVILPCRG
jgi:hypothetical protein